MVTRGTSYFKLKEYFEYMVIADHKSQKYYQLIPKTTYVNKDFLNHWQWKEYTDIDTLISELQTQIDELQIDVDALKNLLPLPTDTTKNYGWTPGTGWVEVTGGGGTDEKVKYDVGDPTAGYVVDKFVAGDGINVTEGVGIDENKLVITNTDKGSDVVVPTKTSELINDNGFITGADVPANETDPVFSASEAANFVAGDKANLDNQSGVNTGDQSSSDFDHNALQNTHNLTTDIDHNSITNTHTIPPQSGDAADTLADAYTIPFWNTVSSVWKKITWANFKAALNSLYVSVTDLFLTYRQRGFYAPCTAANVVLTYDATAKTITMTGTDVRATYAGKLVTETEPTFISGWVSPAHPATDVLYVLSFNGTDIDWRTSFNISDVLIAIKPKGYPFCTREVHPRGVSVEDHTYHHYGNGTIFQSGGETSNIVLDSFTEAERRPYIASTVVNDDGLLDTLAALNTNSYQRLYLSLTDTVNFDTAQTDIIEVGANNRPYYYDFSSGAWVKTLIPRITTGTSASRQRYCSVWLLGIPTTEGDGSEYRYIFVQPQGFSTSLAAEQARNPAEVQIGVASSIIPEFIIFTQYIIRYVPDEGTGDWNIAATVQIRGTRSAPISLSGVGVMPTASQVPTDTTNFDNNLSSADDTVQKALETLDELKDDNLNLASVYSGNLTGATTQQDVNDYVDSMSVGGAHTIQDDDGNDMTARTNLQFLDCEVLDDAGNDVTTVRPYTLGELRSKYYEYFNHFIGFRTAMASNQTRQHNDIYYSTFNAAGSAITQVATGVEIGVIEISTGTTSSGGGTYYTGEAFPSTGGRRIMEVRFKLPTLMSAAQDCQILFGQSDAANTNQIALTAVYSLNTTNLWCSCIKASSIKGTATAVTLVPDTWHKIRIENNEDNTEIYFYMDNVLIYTETDTAYIPVVPLNARGYFVKTAGTTTRTLKVDYVLVQKYLTTEI